MDEKKLAAVRAVKERINDYLPDGVAVSGVGIGMSGQDLAVKVNLRVAPSDRHSLPKEIDGVPVIYDVVGEITPR